MYARDLGSVPVGRPPGGGHSNPFQNPTDRGLAGYSPEGSKESDTTEVT